MHWCRVPESKMRALAALGLDPMQAQASSWQEFDAVIVDGSKDLWSVPLRATSGSSQASECVSLLPEFFDCNLT